MQITYYELSTYNNGVLMPFTIDISDSDTKKCHLYAIDGELSTLENAFLDGEYGEAMKRDAESGFYTFEEWIVADYEDIPSEYVGEYSICDTFFDNYLPALNEHDAEIIEAFIDCFGDCDGLADKISDAFYGEYDNFAQFAEGFFDDIYLHEMPEHLRNYIDYKAFEHDLSFDFVMSGDYVFNRNW